MEVKRVMIWFIIWVVVVFITIPKSSSEESNNIEKLDLPSVSKLIEDEIKKVEDEKTVQELEEYRAKLKQEKELERVELTRQKEHMDVVSRGSDRGLFTVTSYDLSVASCGKSQSHPAYGITASGYSLVGQDRESAMTIATDTKVIPLGTKVYIEFTDEEYKHWSGIYTSRDTGSAIKGKKIDIFYQDMGDNKTDQAVWNFGRRTAKVTIINE